MSHRNTMCPVGLSLCKLYVSLKRRKMRKVVLFVLALIAIVLAEDDKLIEVIAKRFESDVPTVQTCLNEAGGDIEEINTAFQKFSEIKDVNNMNEEIKQSVIKYISFLACMLEKQNMMKDSKLVVDKIIEYLKKEMAPLNEETLTECLNSVNEDSDKSAREDRAFGLTLCIHSTQME